MTQLQRSSRINGAIIGMALSFVALGCNNLPSDRLSCTNHLGTPIECTSKLNDLRTNRPCVGTENIPTIKVPTDGLKVQSERISRDTWSLAITDTKTGVRTSMRVSTCQE